MAASSILPQRMLPDSLLAALQRRFHVCFHARGFLLSRGPKLWLRFFCRLRRGEGRFAGCASDSVDETPLGASVKTCMSVSWAAGAKFKARVTNTSYLFSTIGT